MLATDKQIKYLHALQERYNKMLIASRDILTPDFKTYHIDFAHERTLGMTTIDASLKIEGFKQAILGINMTRALCNRKQL